MFFDRIEDPIFEFVVCVIAHKLYQSIQLNSVLCITTDLGYKLIK